MSTPVRTTSGVPFSTSLRTCSTTAPAGTERDGPRPYGMMQKVQRWSQPFCTSMKARVLDLRRPAGHDDARPRVLLARPPDRLARLAGGLRRHRAGVDDDRIGRS